jgi:Leucine-rich repeat (LRR) protein
MNEEEVGDSMRRFQRLRVLSLLHVGKLPNSIGSLKQLWYINLSESSEYRLSETVCTLHNLRILILRGCKNLVELPTNLMNLTNLYHLDFKGTRLQQMTPQMGKLSELQTLTGFFSG